MNLKNNKASGNDQLPAGVFKSDPALSTDIQHPLFCKILDNDIIPTTCCEGNIIILPKKGDINNCNNWRGITLLSIPSKIFSKKIIARIKTAVDNKLRSEQAGFRTEGAACCDQVFVLRNIIEQCTEWQRHLIINFIDFEKAFDSIHRESLLKILRHYEIPTKIVNLIKAFYSYFKCTVGKSTDMSFLVTEMRLYNSCVLSVLLYGAECWRMTEKDINKRSSFHNGCLRRILKIFWSVKISNENLHEITNSTTMRTILKRYRWRWIGHVLRKPTNNITRVSLIWNPQGK